MSDDLELLLARNLVPSARIRAVPDVSLLPQPIERHTEVEFISIIILRLLRCCPWGFRDFLG